MFQWDYFWTNIANYPRWMMEAHGATIAGAAAGPLLLWRHAALGAAGSTRPMLFAHVAFVIIVWLSYVFYLPLGSLWWSLRFLFPAFPILFVWMAVAILAMTQVFPARSRPYAAGLIVVLIASRSLSFGWGSGWFDSRGEQRYEQVGRLIAAQFPERAAVLANLHSGSVKHYANRLIVRFDLLTAPQLGPAIAHLTQNGYPPFLVLDGTEIKTFDAALSATDWPDRLSRTPRTDIWGVQIYDLSQVPPPSRENVR